MADFTYEPMFRMGEDKTEYKLLSKEGVSTASFEGKDVLKVEAEALSELARQGFSDINYLFRTEHLQSLRNIIEDPEASDNDRYVALTLLQNAVVSSARTLPSCQDTGTAIVFAKKGQRVWTDFDDEEALEPGNIQDVYRRVSPVFTECRAQYVRREEHGDEPSRPD